MIKKSLLTIIGLLSLPLFALAVQITVPSAPSSGYLLISTTTGQYLASSTPSITGLYGGGLVSCNGVSNALTWTNGVFGCNTISASSGTVGTSTSETSGYWPYWTTTGATPALLGATSSPFFSLFSFGNATGTQATTTNFFSTNLSATNASITKLANLTSNGFVKTSGGDGTLSVDTTSYLSSYDAWTHPSAGVSATTSSMIFTNASSTFTGDLNITGNSTTSQATTTTSYTTNFFAQTGTIYNTGASAPLLLNRTDRAAMVLGGGFGSAGINYDQAYPFTIYRDTRADIESKLISNGTLTFSLGTGGNAGINASAVANTTLTIGSANDQNRFFDISSTITNLTADSSYQAFRFVPNIQPTVDLTTVTTGLNNNFNLTGSSANNITAAIRLNNAQLLFSQTNSNAVTTVQNFLSTPPVNNGTGSPSVGTWQGYVAANVNASITPTNIEGFVGQVNTGTNTWNAYMSGTADNYFRGNVEMGTSTPVTSSTDLTVAETTGGIETLYRNDQTLTIGETLGQLNFGGRDVQLTTQQIGANIEAQASQNITTDALATNLIFRTTGTTVGGSPVEAMRITSGQLVGINNSSPSTALDVGGTASSTGLQVNGNATIAGNFTVTGTCTGCGTASFANPTATIGLTAVNGAATTAMRSDAAPALSQAIVPTWTGLHTFNGDPISALFSKTVGIGTTTPQWALTISSSTAPQLSLTDNGSNIWSFRSAGGSFYLATTSPSTFATSSASAFSINTNGIPTFPALGGTSGCAQISSTGQITNSGSACGGAGGSASSTLLTDNNTFSGLNTFSNIAINTTASFFGVTSSATTGTGNMVFSASPSFTGSVSAPIIRGGTGAASTLTLRGSTHASPTLGSAGIIFDFGASGTSETGRIDAVTGLWGLGTTTPQWKLQIASSTAAQLALSDAVATDNHWVFRNAGGLFYLATSSPSTYATSTTAALSLDANGALIIPNLKASAGTFLAADPNGKIIATSSPATTQTSYSTKPMFFQSGSVVQDGDTGSTTEHFGKIYIPNQITFTKMTVGTNNAFSNRGLSVGIYNENCSSLLQTITFSSLNSGATTTATISSKTLSPGVYYLGWVYTGTGTGATNLGLVGDAAPTGAFSFVPTGGDILDGSVTVTAGTLASSCTPSALTPGTNTLLMRLDP